MGKRELVIAVLFIVAGVVVYQVTAPPSDPSNGGFSLRRMADEIRREIRGQRETAETTFTATRPVAPVCVRVQSLTVMVGIYPGSHRQRPSEMPVLP